MCCTWGWEIIRLSVGVTQWTQLSVFAAHYFGPLGSDKKYYFSYKRIAEQSYKENALYKYKKQARGIAKQNSHGVFAWYLIRRLGLGWLTTKKDNGHKEICPWIMSPHVTLIISFSLTKIVIIIIIISVCHGILL